MCYVFPSSFGEFDENPCRSPPARLPWALAGRCPVGASNSRVLLLHLLLFVSAVNTGAGELPLRKYSLAEKQGWLKIHRGLKLEDPLCVPCQELRLGSPLLRALGLCLPRGYARSCAVPRTDTQPSHPNVTCVPPAAGTRS